jgi:hypothetical protein
MPDREDTRVQLVKAPCTELPIDPTLLQPKLQELPPRQNPVLPLSQLGDRTIPPSTCPGRFASPRGASVFDAFRGLGGHGVRLTGLGARVVRSSCQL